MSSMHLHKVHSCTGMHGMARQPINISITKAIIDPAHCKSNLLKACRKGTNTGQGKRRLNARAALRQQEREGSPAPSGTSGAPSLGRTASAGAMPGPSEQPGGQAGSRTDTADALAGRPRSAGVLERTRFLPSRSTRCGAWEFGKLHVLMQKWQAFPQIMERIQQARLLQNMMAAI